MPITNSTDVLIREVATPIQVFLKSSAAILVATASIKIYSLISVSIVKPDPILSIFTNRQVLLIATVMEFLSAFLILFLSNRVLKLFVILWISSAFLGYKLAMEILHVSTCSCLATLGDLVFGKQATVVSNGLLAYLIIGSFLSLGVVLAKEKS